MTSKDTRGGGEGGLKIAATNRKARHEYTVLDTLEAGIELRGTEVKSLREGLCSLNEAFAQIENGQAWLIEAHIQPYRCGNVHNHDPKRKRRLLLHAKEIARLYGLTQVKGQTLIPLRLYFKRGIAKIELGVCRGKQLEDKRETLKRRTAEREAERAMSRASRRG